MTSNQASEGDTELIIERRLLRPDELASFLGIPLATEYPCRSRGNGPCGIGSGGTCGTGSRTSSAGSTSGRDRYQGTRRARARRRGCNHREDHGAHREAKPRGPDLRRHAGSPRPDGREQSRSFAKKSDAEQWLDPTRGDLAHGTYVDPAGGKKPFGDSPASGRQRAFTGRRPSSRSTRTCASTSSHDSRTGCSDRSVAPRSRPSSRTSRLGSNRRQ